MHWEGLRAIAEGLSALGLTDEEKLARGFPIYAALYEYSRQHKEGPTVGRQRWKRNSLVSPLKGLIWFWQPTQRSRAGLTQMPPAQAGCAHSLQPTDAPTSRPL